MSKKSIHADCKFFTPVDVAKGLCVANGNCEVAYDDDSCPNFEAVQKCKYCSNFTTPDEKGFGTCKGFKDNAWTFAELKTKTCENFKQ